jgi:hypothetical protein
VTPGAYTLQIYTADGGPLWFGEMPVTTGENDHSGVSVAMTPGADVHGTFVSDGTGQGFPLVKAHWADMPPIPGGALM